MEIITRDALKTLIDTKGKYVLIDVREKEELAYGMIPTAHHIPLHEMEFALELVPEDFEKKYGFQKPAKEDTVIFYCRSGGRAAMATAFAEQAGFIHAKNYAGSILDWASIDQNVRRY